MNRDDKFFNYFKSISQSRNLKIVSFGVSKKSDVSLFSKRERDIFLIKTKDEIIPLEIKNINVYNVLSSIALLKELNLNIKKIIKYYKTYQPSEGRGRIILEGKKVALINFGARLKECLLANEILNKKGIGITLVDARFAKPLDENLIWQIATDHEAIITIEEGSIGGFGSHVSQFLSEKNLLDNNLKFRSMILPDKFIDHNKPELMYKEAGLDADAIVNKVFDTLNSKIIVQKQK